MNLPSIQKKRTRTRLSISKKLEIAQQLSNGCDFGSVQRKYQVGHRTLSRIKNSIASLRKQANQFQFSFEKKTIRQPTLLSIDEKVLQFVETARHAKMPVTLSLISQRAPIEKERKL